MKPDARTRAAKPKALEHEAVAVGMPRAKRLPSSRRIEYSEETADPRNEAVTASEVEARAGRTGRARAGSLATRFGEIREATLRLAEPLSAEDCALQSMPDASPVKWHLAHTTWFFETFVLERARRGHRPFRPEYRVLFNSYYNTVGGQHPRPERGLLSRPSLAEVLEYRGHLDRIMLDVLGSGPGPGADLAAVVELGLQHEQQHQELILTDVKHLLSCNPMRPAYDGTSLPPPIFSRRGRLEDRITGAAATGTGGGPANRGTATGGARTLRWAAYPEGTRRIGHDGKGFSFDNERPRHRFFVEAFELAARPVSNGEYLAFIQDGGYERPELWLAEGWDAVGVQGWKAPLYWELRDGERVVMTLSGLRVLAESEPVCHVSFYEADAFARWSGARLPTEQEWETAASEVAVEGNFAERGRLHPAPVVDDPNGAAPAALFGDVWEWTRSSYGAYPGYAPPHGALGEYNGKFMCSQLVLRGGSCATPRSHIRATYRNFFPPSARWQFAGIRLARDLR